jgi:hypothetical protein
MDKFDGKIKYKAESIFADKHDEITDYEIIFKKNGDYIQMKNEDDMATYYYYGTYKIDNDFITLTGDVSKEFTSKKFKIIVEKNQKNNLDSCKLVQIDNNSKAKIRIIKFNFKNTSSGHSNESAFASSLRNTVLYMQSSYENRMKIITRDKILRADLSSVMVFGDISMYFSRRVMVSEVAA